MDHATAFKPLRQCYCKHKKPLKDAAYLKAASEGAALYNLCESCSVDRTQSASRKHLPAHGSQEKKGGRRTLQYIKDACVDGGALNSAEKKKRKSCEAMRTVAAEDFERRNLKTTCSRIHPRSRLKTLDQWFTFCSPTNPGIRVATTSGPERRRFWKPKTGVSTSTKTVQCQSFTLSPNFITHEEPMFPWRTRLDVQDCDNYDECCHQPEQIRYVEKESKSKTIHGNLKHFQTEANAKSSVKKSP